MTAITENTDYFVKSTLPNAGFKQLLISTVTTATTSDVISININNYGGGAVMGVIGFKHSTVNSIVVQEQPTTTMDGQTLHITMGASVGARHYLAYLASTANP